MDKKLCSMFGLALGLITFNVFADDAPAAAAAAKPAADPMAITTNAFLDQGTLPVLYTCDGKDVSPQLSWSNLPKTTQSLAVIMVDPTAPGGDFYHWVVFNIPKSVAKVDEDMKNAPAGATMGMNSFKKQQYNGPCPPKGSAHTYIIKLFALNAKLSLPKNADGATVLKEIKKHTVGNAEISAVYSRWINS